MAIHSVLTVSLADRDRELDTRPRPTATRQQPKLTRALISPWYYLRCRLASSVERREGTTWVHNRTDLARCY